LVIGWRKIFSRFLCFVFFGPALVSFVVNLTTENTKNLHKGHKASNF
jgi:hypothetical protein